MAAKVAPVRRAAKVDANHGLIRDTFRALGCWVRDTSGVGEGFPDLLVVKGRGWGLVEVKTAKGTLTPQQEKFREEFPGPYYVVRTIEDAQRVASFFLLEG